MVSLWRCFWQVYFQLSRQRSVQGVDFRCRVRSGNPSEVHLEQCLPSTLVSAHAYIAVVIYHSTTLSHQRIQPTCVWFIIFCERTYSLRGCTYCLPACSMNGNKRSEKIRSGLLSLRSIPSASSSVAEAFSSRAFALTTLTPSGPCLLKKRSD